MEKNRHLQYLVVSAVSLATTTLGMCSLWTTPAMPKLLNNETSIVITNKQISWMLSLSPVGLMIGSLVTRFICDQFGRRTTLLLSAVPIATGTIIAASASKAWWLFIMKILWGFGTGMISSIVIIYIAEIADKDIRGRLSVGTRIAFHFGGLLMMCIGAVATYDVTNYLLLAMPVLFFCACLWIPESPYYYLMKGRQEDAKTAFVRLRGTSEDLDLELERIKSHVKMDMRNPTTTLELLRGKQYRRAVIIVVGLKLVQIMSGTQAVQQYLAVIMKESGAELPFSIMLIIFGAIKFVVGLMSSFLADRVGRRPLFIFSFLGCSIALATVGTYFFLLEVIKVDHDSIKPFALLAFIGIVSSNVLSTLGFNSIAGVVQGEVFPLNVKAVAITSLNIYGGILGFLTLKLFQEVKDAGGLCGVFWMYASITFIGSVFSYFCIPETKGKSLREIQVMLQGEEYDEQEMKSMNEKEACVDETQELKEIKGTKS
ncbi:facilitated trehalose transporter Tret1 isoform X2 [Pieris rapae]|nr:facilitated trehalose transporter Tret1 isoform X2 [Pieris rapae]XP_022124310.2 facilitated trehalose transporter Tret1 isoform X2 [Pieris rapae]